MAIVLAIVIFNFDNLRGKRSVPMAKWSGIPCFKNSCSTPILVASCDRLVENLWSNVWFKSNISLLIFSLDNLSIGERELNSPTIIVYYPFKSVSICLKHLVALM